MIRGLISRNSLKIRYCTQFSDKFLSEVHQIRWNDEIMASQLVRSMKLANHSNSRRYMTSNSLSSSFCTSIASSYGQNRRYSDAYSDKTQLSQSNHLSCSEPLIIRQMSIQTLRSVSNNQRTTKSWSLTTYRGLRTKPASPKLRLKLSKGTTTKTDKTETKSDQTPSKTKDTQTTTSNRKAFRSIPIDPVILSRLDLLQLGTISSRSERETYASKSSQLKRTTIYQNKIDIVNSTPHLFKREGTKLGHISKVKELNGLVFRNHPPEVAIIGRSNVGKSSLLNKLLGYNDSYIQKSSVSDKPGETKDLIFYGVKTKQLSSNPANSLASSEASVETENTSLPSATSNLNARRAMSLIITDMPGYGFAYLNEEDKQRCMDLTRQYLLHRGKSLKRLLVILDARHGVKIGDKEFFKELLTEQDKSKKTKVSWKFQIVLTKCDLVSRSDLARRISKLESELSDMFPSMPGNMLRIVPVSSLENKGIKDLQRDLAALVSLEPESSSKQPLKTSMEDKKPSIDSNRAKKGNDRPYRSGPGGKNPSQGKERPRNDKSLNKKDSKRVGGDSSNAFIGKRSKDKRNPQTTATADAPQQDSDKPVRAKRSYIERNQRRMENREFDDIPSENADTRDRTNRKPRPVKAKSNFNRNSKRPSKDPKNKAKVMNQPYYERSKR